MKILKTVIIDNQKMFVQAFSSLMLEMNNHNIKLVGIYNTLSQFDAKKYEDLDLIITDLNICEDLEYSYIGEFKHRYGAKVIVLSNISDYKIVRKVMMSGAEGYILKTSEYAEFMKAVDEVIANRTHLGKNVYIAPIPQQMKEKMGFNVHSNIEKRHHLKNMLTRREH